MADIARMNRYGKSGKIAITIDPDLTNYIEEQAARQGRPFSRVIADLMRRGYNAFQMDEARLRILRETDG